MVTAALRRSGFQTALQITFDGLPPAGWSNRRNLIRRHQLLLVPQYNWHGHRLRQPSGSRSSSRLAGASRWLGTFSVVPLILIPFLRQPWDGLALRRSASVASVDSRDRAQPAAIWSSLASRSPSRCRAGKTSWPPPLAACAIAGKCVVPARRPCADGSSMSP